MKWFLKMLDHGKLLIGRYMQHNILYHSLLMSQKVLGRTGILGWRPGACAGSIILSFLLFSSGVIEKYITKVQQVKQVFIWAVS